MGPSNPSGLDENPDYTLGIKQSCPYSQAGLGMASSVYDTGHP